MRLTVIPLALSGYNAILISTIVDNGRVLHFRQKGYNAILISTIVDNGYSYAIPQYWL